MRTITLKQLVESIEQALASNTLCAQHGIASELLSCNYRCAIGAALTQDECELATLQGAFVPSEIRAVGIADFEHSDIALQLACAHDDWAQAEEGFAQGDMTAPELSARKSFFLGPLARAKALSHAS